VNHLRSFLTQRGVACVALVGLVTLPAMGWEAPSKGVIERPTKEVLAARSGSTPTVVPFGNPKVAPGRVFWHPSFDAACAAARVSGKPVLLFQMMGNLDEQFC
jgi:hypothetical protein